MKKTKIVCTLGPASEEKSILTDLILQGLNVTRFNFSHGNHEEHKVRINLVKEVSRELDIPVAIMLDTKGPEIRTGDFKDGHVELKKGENVIITAKDMLGDSDVFSITYKKLAQDVEIGDTILIDDGLIGLEVLEIIDDDIKCLVKNTGEVKNKKGINVPGVKIGLPAITDKDIKDIKFGIENGIDLIAASFIRKPEDVIEIRKVLEENNADDIQIISKIESQEGLDNIDGIIEVSDGIMVARGDLGVEIPAEDVPLAQKQIIEKCNRAGKPVIIATQMLDSMIRNPRPTRAEVNDVAIAVYDGADAIMLSGETAIGKFPIEAVKIMSNIAKKIEASLDYKHILSSRIKGNKITMTNAISHATCTTAQDMQANAIITATSSGYTARAVSKFRPKAPIIAATTSRKVMRKLSLMWGVYPVLTEETNSTDEIIDISVKKALEKQLIKNGDLVVITAGVPVGVAGSTNLIKVHIVGDILLKGTGIGKSSTTGRVCIVKDVQDAERKFKDGDILVAIATDKNMTKFMERASAIITEEGGLTSHAAVVGISIGKPVIVGTENATKELKDGNIITVDSHGGVVYKGRTRIL